MIGELGTELTGACGTCRDVQRVAERAFWDALEEGLRASPPQWERLVVLLGEAREALADIIPEASQEGRNLRSSLAEKLDLVCSPICLLLPPPFPVYLHQLVHKELRVQ